jgi:hypothetical protein
MAINLRRGSTEVDLLVWESGEADLSIMEDDGSTKQEHFDSLVEPRELALVLARVAAMMHVMVAR